MAWSTREIAELAGTSLRAVRHYHEVGLLAQPERRANGYKQYGVAHLVRVIRIKRLTDLGFSLPQIAEMGPEDDHPEHALRTLDAELAATIQGLQRARVELDMIRAAFMPTDLPADLAPAVADADMSEVDRSLVVVLARVLGPTSLQTIVNLLRDPRRDPASAEFDDLPADADTDRRQTLAERIVPYLRALHDDHPGLAATPTDAVGGPNRAARTIGTAMRDLYNPAQIDVLKRVDALLQRPKRRATNW